MEILEKINENQLGILYHTRDRAAGGRYCGGGYDMDVLVELGLMQYLGMASWCPDKFYSLTEKGRKLINNK